LVENLIGLEANLLNLPSQGSIMRMRILKRITMIVIRIAIAMTLT
jgi:hypothetical protein